MEHIAHEVGKDPLSVRMKNTMKTDPTEALVTSLKEKSDFEQRKSAVDEFNKVCFGSINELEINKMRLPSKKLNLVLCNCL